MTSGRERYIEQYRRDHAGGGARAEVARLGGPVPVRRRLGTAVALGAVSVPGLLPFTALVGVAVTGLGRAFGPVAAVVAFVVVFAAVGAVVQRVGVAQAGARRGGRRRAAVAAAATALVVAAAVTEMASGSRAPDPILLLWFAAFAWLLVFVPLVDMAWSALERWCWTVAPVAVLVLAPFVATDGYFGLRFDRARADLDRYVAEIDAGATFVAGREVGGFTVHSRGRLAGCDHAFRISGWHERDDRWIAWCPTAAPPDAAGVEHLAGDWYEYDG
jgi:hypothetical protein